MLLPQITGLQKCDPLQANEALWGWYQKLTFKIQHIVQYIRTFWHQNDSHIIFHQKLEIV